MKCPTLLVGAALLSTTAQASPLQDNDAIISDLIARALPANAPHGYAPQTDDCPSTKPRMRPGGALSQQETDWLKKRRDATIQPMQDLLKRMQPPNAPSHKAKAKGKAKEIIEDPVMVQNRHYAAELLSILMQGDYGSHARQEYDKLNGVEITLKLLSAYRKQDPSGAEDVEYMENLFNVLCSGIWLDSVKVAFVREEKQTKIPA